MHTEILKKSEVLLIGTLITIGALGAAPLLGFAVIVAIMIVVIHMIGKANQKHTYILIAFDDSFPMHLSVSFVAKGGITNEKENHPNH